MNGSHSVFHAGITQVYAASSASIRLPGAEVIGIGQTDIRRNANADHTLEGRSFIGQSKNFSRAPHPELKAAIHPNSKIHMKEDVCTASPLWVWICTMLW